jgi:hypothetical protein
MLKTALTGASAAAVIALAPLCIPPAQAHADDPCVSITDPAARQACINKFPPDDATQRDPMGNCQESPDYGAEGQFCRNSWVRKSLPPNGRHAMWKGLRSRGAFEGRQADPRLTVAAEKGIGSVKTSAPEAKVVDLT